jgi:hypothetical protein
MTGSGRLNVTVDSESWFLKTTLPYVVRDAHLAVVHTGSTGEQPITLPEGLYSVEVTAPDGARSTSVVQVKNGATAQVDVPTDTATAGDDTGARTRGSPDMTLETVTDSDQPARATAAALESVTGCNASQTGDYEWEFEPVSGVVAVPTAVFTLGDRRIEMSLAVNPQADRAELGACQVSRVWERGAARLRMSFAPERRVCVTMDGLLRRNDVYTAAGMLEQATGLLWDKYQDPPGAALGGLILHGMGRTGEHPQWLANLARDFPWLPDGRILLAALLMKEAEPARRQPGLDALLSATTQRPMYTDGLSLAMELLRRWPDDESLPARTERLTELAKYSAYADWDSVNLSVDITERDR